MNPIVSVNLLPEELVAAHTCRRHARRWIGACVAAAVVLSAPLGLEWYRVTRAAELDVEYTRLRQERDLVKAELVSVIATSRETFLQIERAKALRTKRPWSGIIALLSSTMPEGCWLVELATDPPAPTGQQTHARAQTAANGADVAVAQTVVIEAPRMLRITGFAADAGDPLAFVSNLKQTAVFEHVDLERTQREPIADGFYFRFELKCEW